MGAPVLTITPIPIIPAGSIIDLTALTGGINGETGADYNIGINLAQKLDGGGRCQYHLSGVATGGGYYYTGFTLNTTDANTGNGNSEAFTTSSAMGASAGQSTPPGASIVIDASNQVIGQFFWHGSTYNSKAGDITVTASISDASSPNVVYTLPGANSFNNSVVQVSFRVDFAGIAPNASVTLQFLKTDPSGGPTNFGSHVCYTLPTTPAPSPAGLILGF